MQRPKFDIKGKQNIKKTVSEEGSRRKREETTVELRRKRKEELLMKKRSTGSGIVDDNSQVDPSSESIARLAAMFQVDDPQIILQATVGFRKILSLEANPPIDEVINSGIVPRLVQLVTRSENTRLQFEACWALTNIASGTSQHTHAVVDAGAVPAFIVCLSSNDNEVVEQACWALGNVAGDATTLRDYVLEQGALDLIVQVLARPNNPITLMRNATWTVSNLCRGRPRPNFEFLKRALDSRVLNQLIYSNDLETLVDALWALSYISDGDDAQIQGVIDLGVTRKLVELLMHPQPTVKTPALRTVGNLVTGNDSQTQVVLNCNALTALLSLLSYGRRTIRKEACWAISNVTAGIQSQIQAVIDANIVPPVIQLVSRGEFEVKREAAWVIANATTGGSLDQIDYLVTQGSIPPLCDLLETSDVRVVTVALEAIENILKAGSVRNADDNPYARFVEEAGGLDKIEALQTHQNQDIYHSAVTILESFFNAEEEEASDEEKWESIGQQGTLNMDQSFGSSQPPHSGFQF